MKHLYFVRHGLSVMNAEGVWSGRTETPLTEKGIVQCHEAGRQLQGAGINVIVSSPTHRAHHTAEIIAEELGIDPANIITNDAFEERDFGPLEGTDYQSGRNVNDIDGVEHSDDLIERVSKGLDFIRTLDADTVLVVSHGAVGRALQVVLGKETSFHRAQKIRNAQVVQFL